ncbi:hypothetical protein E4L99_15215 [Lysinibacillus sp. S2017]|nr:hypothetical protein E4L99_15215 [Lysinibacillus sp. S2017]
MGTHQKATNTVKSVFVAFCMEHFLYVNLCTFYKSHYWQRFERVFWNAASLALLHKIVHILIVVNPHKSDATHIKLSEQIHLHLKILGIFKGQQKMNTILLHLIY